MGPTPASIPQMDLPDSGLTYLPWAQPLTTISTMPSPGVQFAPGSAALPGSPLVHMPLSMSLTTMIPQLEAQGVDPHPQILDLPQRSDQQLDPGPQGQSLDEDPGVEAESPSLLDKLLEAQKDDGSEQDKDSYSSSLFISNVWKYVCVCVCVCARVCVFSLQREVHLFFRDNLSPSQLKSLFCSCGHNFYRLWWRWTHCNHSDQSRNTNQVKWTTSCKSHAVRGLKGPPVVSLTMTLQHLLHWSGPAQGKLNFEA